MQPLLCVSTVIKVVSICDFFVDIFICLKIVPKKGGGGKGGIVRYQWMEIEHDIV